MPLPAILSSLYVIGEMMEMLVNYTVRPTLYVCLHEAYLLVYAINKGLSYSNGLFVKPIDYALSNNIACEGAKFGRNFTRKK